jgi:hypothetical protein
MIESFDCTTIDLYSNIFIEYYYYKLKEYGVKYDYSEYKKDILYSICHFPFFVAIWFGTTSDKNLIDKNFPFFYIQKLYSFIDKYNIDSILI